MSQDRLPLQPRAAHTSPSHASEGEQCRAEQCIGEQCSGGVGSSMRQDRQARLPFPLSTSNVYVERGEALHRYTHGSEGDTGLCSDGRLIDEPHR